MIGELLLIALASLVVSLAVTPIVRSFALRHTIADYRSSWKIHSKFVPRLGCLGIYDDIGVGSLRKLVVQFLTAGSSWPHKCTVDVSFRPGLNSRSQEDDVLQERLPGASPELQ